MKKLLVIQIALFVVFAGSLGGLLVYTDVYSDIKSDIVDKTCFSCIKMDPVTRFVFIYETVDNQPHPDFVKENLTKGPVFLAFRSNVCGSCDKMEIVIKDFFEVEFGLKELFHQDIDFDGNTVSFYHINVNDPYEIESDSFYIYDFYRHDGVPMFVLITLGNNSGVVQPYYTVAYGALQLDNNKDREAYFNKMIMKGIELYNTNIDDYNEAAD